MTMHAVALKPKVPKLMFSDEIIVEKKKGVDKLISESVVMYGDKYEI